MPPLAVGFWALVAVGAFGLFFDVYALKVASARRLAIATLLLKVAVPAAFVCWWLYYRVLAVGAVQGFEDLAVLVGIMMLSSALLLAALACELAAWAAVKRAEGTRE